MSTRLHAAVNSSVAALLKTAVSPGASVRVEGGCINTCFRCETGHGGVFVKVADTSALDAFQAEAVALEELKQAGAIRVPRVLAVGAHEQQALLVLEWLELQRLATAQRVLGQQLALQHRVTKPLYGFKRNNYIGATAQTNYWSRSWLNFWREHRLEAQLNLAERNGAGEVLLERASLLLAMLDDFFAAYAPKASLLHGDLWSGNWGADERGAPVVFDPAVYYGDRECDIAMTRLFGGFSQDFYAAYEDTWPLEEGSQQRGDLYNLYHVLNHFNLFGGGYLAQAERMIDKLLAELGH